MAKKKEQPFVPLAAAKPMTAEDIEALRKKNFPNVPPPTLRQLKAMKNKKKNEKD